MRVFVDESGHSGKNVYDDNQPIYTSAGVWVDQDVRSELEEAVREAKSRNHIQMPELKGKKLRGRHDVQKTVHEIARTCQKLDISIFLVALHKRFMPASVIVEDGADPKYNPAYSHIWYRNALAKELEALLIF